MLSEGPWWWLPERIGTCSMEEPVQKVCVDLSIVGFKIETRFSQIKSERGRWYDQLIWEGCYHSIESQENYWWNDFREIYMFENYPYGTKGVHACDQDFEEGQWIQPIHWGPIGIYVWVVQDV